MNLKDLVVDSKEVSVDYPGMEGFSVTVAYLNKETLVKMQKRCTVSKFNKKRQLETEIDFKLFNKEFAAAAVKGWSGLKYKYLESFMVVDLSKVSPEDELQYNPDNALILLESSNDFDGWLNEVLSDLDTFRGTAVGTAS